jgi:hypothetical protein
MNLRCDKYVMFYLYNPNNDDDDDDDDDDDGQ